MERDYDGGLAAAMALPDRVVLEGFHAVKHALRFEAPLDALVTHDAAALADLVASHAPDLASTLATAASVSRDVVRRVAPRLASPLLGVGPAPVAAPPVEWDPRRPVVVLEDPRHAGNAGAVVRVAAAADAAAVVLVGGPAPTDRTVLRTSAGLVHAVPTLRVEDLRDLVPLAAVHGRTIVAADPTGGAPPDRWPEPAPLLLFGTERAGLTPAARDLAAASWALPMRPGVSSLNLATAVAALLYRIG